MGFNSKANCVTAYHYLLRIVAWKQYYREGAQISEDLPRAKNSLSSLSIGNDASFLHLPPYFGIIHPRLQQQHYLKTGGFIHTQSRGEETFTQSNFSQHLGQCCHHSLLEIYACGFALAGCNKRVNRLQNVVFLVQHETKAAYIQWRKRHVVKLLLLLEVCSSYFLLPNITLRLACDISFSFFVIPKISIRSSDSCPFKSRMRKAGHGPITLVK